MKIGTDLGFHLTYCTNIHPGEGWSEVLANLEKYVPELKARLAPGQPFGIGLRCSDLAARELLEGDALAKFQMWLAQQDFYVFTLNGFPYGGFHHQVVKDQVYAPDWSKQERLDYTLRLVKILAALLPEGMDGGISTLPLSYKPWLTGDKAARESVLRDGSVHLALVAAEMARIREETGKLLHIDLEPEPDGLIENAAEVIDFFKEWLLPIAGACLAERLGISRESAEARLLEHVRICYDTCHFAVEYEDPASVFAQLQAAGIRIGKIQISAAMRVILPEDSQKRSMVVERLRPFAESTYLHQVIERRVDGTLHRYPDLVKALPYLEQSTAFEQGAGSREQGAGGLNLDGDSNPTQIGAGESAEYQGNQTQFHSLLPAPSALLPLVEWRTHFHVPIFIRDYYILHSTQDDIVSVLDLLRTNHACKHLEIETYTWDVLPKEMKMDLLVSIQREYEWVLATFASTR